MKNSGQEKNDHKRRDFLKAIAATPVLGLLGYGVTRKYFQDHNRNDELLKALGLQSESNPNQISIVSTNLKNDPHLRLGIIGAGGRGQNLLEAAGFTSPEKIDDWKNHDILNHTDRYENYLQQEDLNISIVAVCDIFDEHARLALEASGNKEKLGVKDYKGTQAKRYKSYNELLADKNVDAVIIATPDHWHAPIAIEAAKAGKHVYLEKPMTHSYSETFLLRDVVKKSGIVFQVGHQGRQTDSYIKAEEIIRKGILGKINLIETTTNRNSPNGAWVYNLHPKANQNTIDWKQFLGNKTDVPFDLKRFFRWRCWWDYGTGLTGDLLTHEFDAINQVMKLGIPHSCVTSGGIYYYKDGREVPDVLQSVFEYPNRDLTFMYSATLASNRHRGKVFMGSEGHMEMDGTTTLYIDRESKKYKHLIQDKIIKPDEPAVVFSQSSGNIDAITSATAKYFAKRGLLYTYRNGKRVDTTHLHIKEWIHCIRENIQPSCNIDQGFEEAIVALMATISYREGKKVYWDPDKEQIISG